MSPLIARLLGLYDLRVVRAGLRDPTYLAMLRKGWCYPDRVIGAGWRDDHALCHWRITLQGDRVAKEHSHVRRSKGDGDPALRQP